MNWKAEIVKSLRNPKDRRKDSQGWCSVCGSNTKFIDEMGAGWILRFYGTGQAMAFVIVVVNVALKPEILDPQGRAVLGALGRLGLSGVADVRQGKQFVLNIDGDVDEAKLAQIHEIASTLLSNPVIEDFTVEVQA
jgi:phosphoribosylformylglycinamidine synthase subunit PurS